MRRPTDTDFVVTVKKVGRVIQELGRPAPQPLYTIDKGAKDASGGNYGAGPVPRGNAGRFESVA